MDLEPFGRINPCGYVGLQMTQLAALGSGVSVAAAARGLAPFLLRRLGLSGADADLARL
jgi:lipoyl(octanoyl) transferase